MSDIFLSYDSSDRPTARLMADALEAHGWSVWWDREIPLGQSFDQVIEQELNSARCAVVLWSRESVRSRWVRAEASAAISRECLVPILIEDAPIPLEFKQVQAAALVGWAGDTTDPEFVRLLHAIHDLIRRTPGPGVLPQPIGDSPAAPPWWRNARAAVGAVAAAILLIAVLTFTAGRQEQGAQTTASSRLASGAGTATGPLASTAMSIAIGDRIEDGIPGPGAGRIETPNSEDAYVFTAAPGQRVYFRVVGHSDGLSYVTWRLVDADGMELFNACFGCTEPGVHELRAGGAYTLIVGGNKDPATGTYRLRLYDVPPPHRFTVKADDTIREDVPGTGAGAIESPGADDVYVLTAVPQQRVYFRSLQRSSGMDYITWALTDDDGTQVFSTCLGCSEPGVQTLTKGGTYTLTVGSRAVPTTGTYRVRLSSVPPPDAFSITVGERIRPGVSGAGSIEAPGAEDIYSFTAAPGQRVYVRLVSHDKSLDSIRWRLLDDNDMELFNTCLGCSAPDLQQLTGGGRYRLVVGTTTDPSTGAYSFETGSP